MTVQLSNFPPSDEAAARVNDLIAAVDRWRAERPEITDEDTAAKLEDLDRQLMAEAKRVDKLHAEERFVVAAQLKTIDDRWGPLTKAIEACRLTLRPLRTAWLSREQRRLDAERAEARRKTEEAQRAALEAARKAEAAAKVSDVLAAQRAQEAAAEAARAAAAIPERAQVRGAISGRARSLKTTWHADVIDLFEALAHYSDRPAITELVIKMANADARSGVREIPGCRVYSTQE